MSIWKSPILYIGLLLVVVVGGALLAPFIIDWNRYRDDLEHFGSRLSGRQVTIAGPIAVHLFPWPELDAERVQVANEQGFKAEPLLSAAKVTVHLTLAGLFAGDIRVESIDFSNPILNLAVNKDGKANWHFTPPTDFPAARLLSNVQLEQITLADGIVNMTDDRHGWSRRLTNVNGLVSGAALEGPWKLRSTSMAGDLPLDISVSTGVYKPGQPLQLAFRASPLDGSLPAFTFDGKGDASNWTGTVRLDPVVTSDGRTSLVSSLKPLIYQAKVATESDKINLTDIHISAADPKDTATLIQGEVSIDLSRGQKVNVTLNAPHIDLDDLAGAQEVRIWQAGGLMAVANQLIAKFPESLDFNSRVDVASLTAAGENLENVGLSASAAFGAVRIKDLTSDLPGRSRMKFAGIIFPGQGSAELGGSLAFETSDARAFSQWLWPEGKDTITKVWTGSRGRLRSQMDVTWGGKRFGLQNLQYELDSLPGKGELAVTLGQIPALSLNLTANQFDLGSYVSGGLTSMGLTHNALALLPSDGGFDKHMQMKFGSFTINGVEANDVALDVNSTASGFEVKSFDIGAVEGAELHGNGLVLMGPDGPSGDIKFATAAQRPQGLMRMLGVLPNGPDPLWALNLGQTNLRADLNIKPGKDEPQVSYSVSGTTGPYKLVSSGAVSMLLAPNGPTLTLSGTLASGDAADIYKLVGFTPQTGGASDGQLSVSANGNVTQGFKTAIEISGMGASSSFSGTYVPGPALNLDGSVKLEAQDGGMLLRAIGFPVDVPEAGSVSVEAQLKPKDGVLAISDLSIKAARQEIKGRGSLGPGHTIHLDLAGGSLSLPDLLALNAAPWNGVGSWPGGSFETLWPHGFSGEIWLKPAAVSDVLGLLLGETVVGLSASQDGRGFSVVARAADGRNLQVDGMLKPVAGSYQLDGTFTYPLLLEKLYATDDKQVGLRGPATVAGTFSANGRSPMSLLSTLQGSGTVDLQHDAIRDLSPGPFFAAIKDVKSTEEIQKSFGALASGDGIDLPSIKINFTAKDGALTTDPVAFETDDAQVKVTALADAPNGIFRTTVSLQSKSQPDFPPMSVIYEGLPGEMRMRSDTTALASRLGTELINKDMAELDRLQDEQKKAEADAAAQTAQDQAKFDAYQAQRAELRLQQRMLKVFAQQRILDAAHYKASVDAAVSYGNSIVKDEKKRLINELSKP